MEIPNTHLAQEVELALDCAFDKYSGLDLGDGRGWAVLCSDVLR